MSPLAIRVIWKTSPFWFCLMPFTVVQKNRRTFDRNLQWPFLWAYSRCCQILQLTVPENDVDVHAWFWRDQVQLLKKFEQTLELSNSIYDLEKCTPNFSRFIWKYNNLLWYTPDSDWFLFFLKSWFQVTFLKLPKKRCITWVQKILFFR